MVDSQAEALRNLTQAVETLTAEVRGLKAQLEPGDGTPGTGADDALARATRLAALRAGVHESPE